jgi:hypothetical protein
MHCVFEDFLADPLTVYEKTVERAIYDPFADFSIRESKHKFRQIVCAVHRNDMFSVLVNLDKLNYTATLYYSVFANKPEIVSALLKCFFDHNFNQTLSDHSAYASRCARGVYYSVLENDPNIRNDIRLIVEEWFSQVKTNRINSLKKSFEGAGSYSMDFIEHAKPDSLRCYFDRLNIDMAANEIESVGRAVMQHACSIATAVIKSDSHNLSGRLLLQEFAYER